MGVIRLNHRASLTSQLIQDKGWQGCQSLLETVDMRNMSWDSAINPSNGQIEKRVLLPGPKDNSNRKIFFHNCSQVRKLTTERLRQAASFVNAEMATRVTMAASRWQVRKGWSQQFLLVCEKQTNKQTTSSDPEKHSLKFSGGQRRYFEPLTWALGTNLSTGSKNTFHHFFAHFVQLTKALMNNYYSKYRIYMSETKA